jgi:6-phosphogluconate dehydrogenase
VDARCGGAVLAPHLLARALEDDPELAAIEGYVEDSGMGRWTVHEAVEMAVPVPALADALFARFASRQPDSFSAKVIAACGSSSAATR